MFRLELDDTQIQELARTKIFDYDENYDYRNWLLKPSDSNKSENSKALVDFDNFFSPSKLIDNSNRSNSFELIDINDGKISVFFKFSKKII
jgi:hypothetical protein